ncbi:RIB43A-like with coiled-coils protein 2 isoform X1 [Neofelis nebulosa]|uniref:RIB43A-like with coiled-coils protein 2 isoform X1 n=1 Tax=Neofelis nebulosa TaxID=61452 RepID=UPI00272B48CF|nr:RIB43A-like with coiled-coils protein 2 isoform X1 [Neofelis nebulosa]
MEIAQPRDLERYLSLAKRTHGELCRQKRIFNARNRIIGGDTDAWDAQVHDQKIKEATEKARHETFAAEMRQNDKITCILEGRERRDRKSLCKAINDFQQTFQKPETRREFDLSDPLALRKDLPARQSDNDIRNTVSGMQKFMGEDLNFHERKKFQEEQNREWSLQQQRERERARAHQRCAEDLYFKTRLQFDETAKHLQSLESATRKAVCAAVKEFNRNQTMPKRRGHLLQGPQRIHGHRVSGKEDSGEKTRTRRRLGRDLQPAAWGPALREPAAGSQLLRAPPRGPRPLEGHDPGAAGADPSGSEAANPGEAAAAGRRVAARQGLGPAEGAEGSLHSAPRAAAETPAAGPTPGTGLRQPQPGQGAALAEKIYGRSLYKSTH